MVTLPKSIVRNFRLRSRNPEKKPYLNPNRFRSIACHVRYGRGSKYTGRGIGVHVKPTGELLKLAVGDAFEIGTVQGFVVLINDGKVVMEVNGEEKEFRRPET